MSSSRLDRSNFFPKSFLLLILLIAGCGEKGKEKASGGEHELTERKARIRLKHYLIEGQRLYTTHCSNCHQKDGTGLGRLIPPLKDADFMKKDVDRTICIVKYGLTGKIMVNRKDYNHNMPGNNELTELEMAEVVTYVYNTWGGVDGIITVERVRRALEGCAGG